MLRWLVWMARALPAAPALSGGDTGSESGATTLRYAAYVAGAPVGEAEVMVSVNDGRYRVDGAARSSGWLGGFSDWRNRFRAQGLRDGGRWLTTEFAYSERDRSKHRLVRVRDGRVEVTKNGKERPPRPSPRGPDVLRALFIQPGCDLDRLHTGRYAYRLERLAGDGPACRYRVTDDDGERYEIELALARRDGLVVPARITVRTWLTGHLELVEP
ncbi:MAG: DUF3108 domain-containing protein [Pseudomonadota bacterium]